MTSDSRYDTLVRILDTICSEAPSRFNVYHPDRANQDALIRARSRAYLHLYLKVKFGLLDFVTRESQITDGSFDGGLDAYHIDQDNKLIYCLQAKFRATAANFQEKQVGASDLIKVQLKRIVKGETKDLAGGPYNAGVQKFQRAIRKITNIGQYEYRVLILGNARSLHKDQLKKLCDDFPVEDLDHRKVYEDLVFPVVNGIYFNQPDLTIDIKLTNVRRDKDHVDYSVRAERQQANVLLLFVPTEELGRILYTYKNSILRFNPRSFLELRDNPVNRDIHASIVRTKNNEFALFNNGVTLLSDKTHLNTEIGAKGVGQLVVTNPQIINGGQTAYTLSRIYEEKQKGRANQGTFKGKEVLLRVITIRAPKTSKQAIARQRLVSDISKASNSQTKVEEADRRSNERIQIELQKRFFDSHGLFYERKKGEFADGLREGYIDKAQLVDRERLMRVALAIDGTASLAKTSVKKFFSEEGFPTAPLHVSHVDKYVFGYGLLREFKKVRRLLRRSGENEFKRIGTALRYGEYAVVSIAVRDLHGREIPPATAASIVLRRWKSFESWAKRRGRNRKYFVGRGAGFVSYYKGATLNQDLRRFPFALASLARRAHHTDG